SGLGGIALGAGAVWVADPQDGTIWQIRPGPPLVERTVTVGIGVGPVAFGAGALWAANPMLGTVSRVDPASDAVHTVSVGGTPRAITAGDAGAWVSVDPVPSGLERAGVQTLPAPACGAVVTGGGDVQFLIASDLPLRGSTLATGPMTRAIAY